MESKHEKDIYLLLYPIDIGFHASKSKESSERSALAAFSFLYLKMVKEIVCERNAGWFSYPWEDLFWEISYTKYLHGKIETCSLFQNKKTKNLKYSNSVHKHTLAARRKISFVSEKIKECNGDM